MSENKDIQLKNMLEDRKYKLSLVDAAIRKASAIPRSQVLKKMVLPLLVRDLYLWSLMTLDCRTCSPCRESTGG